ncbi:MAG: hypothetical protein ACJAZ2_000339 [Glaciecola sp.]|jgi:hypothetical protein
MQDIEPHYNWRGLYVSEEDEFSPFYETVYSEFSYTDRIYNFYLHPQWDNIGSPTLFLKIIYADYKVGCAIIELIGEWNDCINNDVMFLKRELADHLALNGINKYILIGENVLNFHYSDDSYYEEWFDELEDGWVVALNFQEHVLREFATIGIDQYFIWGGELDGLNWRPMLPRNLIATVEGLVNKRLL